MNATTLEHFEGVGNAANLQLSDVTNKHAAVSIRTSKCLGLALGWIGHCCPFYRQQVNQ